jgi:hypothetical protein
VERPGKGAGFTTVCGCPVAARCQSLLSRIFFTRPHHLSTSPFSRSTLVYTTVFLSFKLKEGRFGVALASYPHYPSWVYPKTGRTVPKRGRSDAAAPPLRHKCTRRDAWHGASHTRRRQKRRADHAWRENQLLGLTQTMHVVVHLTWVSGFQPCAVAFACFGPRYPNPSPIRCSGIPFLGQHSKAVSYSAFSLGTKRVGSKLTHFCGLGRTRSLFNLSGGLNLISCLIT